MRTSGIRRRVFLLDPLTITLCAAAIALGAVRLAAQEPAPAPAPAAAAEPEERSTGLPKAFDWTFNFDAGGGYFGFGHSLYANVRPDPSGDLSANWLESYMKPALSMSYHLSDGELYGKLSAVGERTFSAPPSEVVGQEAASFQVEDLYLGWRSGDSLGQSKDLLDVYGGRAPYKIGHGMLLWDGAGEGGSRGGFWTNARKAWEVAGVVRLKPGPHTFEVFYLDRDELPENDSGSKLWGANYDLALGEATTLGVTYLDVSADPAKRPLRDGLHVIDGRAYTAPFPGLSDLSFELEYALEDNDLVHSEAWTAQASYQLSGVAWKPKLTYRYAFFEGDDPKTAKSESFDSLFPGFYDWGTWWQGEIGGEYFLANSNLRSNMVRVHVSPNDKIGGGLFMYLFELDQPKALGPGVTSNDVMVEFDAYCDWKLNANFTLSIVAAYGNPRQAVEQAFGRTDDFTYGMLYLAYSF
jgi:alginate export protein